MIGVALLAAVAAAHDFTTGNGSSPGGPGDPGDENGCPCGPSGGDPVMLFSGDFTEERVDVRLPGRKIDLELRFMYRSQSAYNGPYGYGWDHNYNRRLRRLENGDLVLQNGQNWTDEFIYDSGTGTYTKPEYFYGDVVQNPDGSITLRYPDGRRERFDLNGNLSRMEDRFGNGLDFIYSPTKLPILGASDYFVDQDVGVVGFEYLLLRIEDTVGRAVDLMYNSDNRLASVAWLGRSVMYEYDPDDSGELIAVTAPATDALPAGSTTRYGYDASHRLTSIVDPKGVTFLTNTYNTSNRVVSQVVAGGTFGFAYGVDALSQATTTVTDPLGDVTRYTFDALGHVIQREDLNDGVPAGEPAAYVTAFVYNAKGELVREVSPRGSAVEYKYSPTGKVTEIRRKKIGAAPGVNDAADIVLAFTYESHFDLAKTVTDPRGVKVTYTYDYELGEPDKGLLRRVDYPDVAGQPIRETITYNAFGQVETFTDATGAVIRRNYDAATGQVKEIVAGFGTPLAATTRFDHDGAGNITAIIDPRGQTTRVDFDQRDRPIRITTPMPQAYVTSYRYDQNGNLHHVDRQRGASAPPQLPALGVVDAEDGWQSTIYQYDSFDRLIGVVDDLSNTTVFQHDAAGNRVAMIDPEGFLTTYVYGERGQLDQMTAPGASAPSRFSYDGNGNTTSITDPNGNVTTLVYDDFDRPVLASYPGGGTTMFAYDATSNVLSSTTPGGQTITYTYDPLNRLTSRTSPAGQDTYAYDRDGRMVAANNALAQLGFAYDTLGRLTSATTKYTGVPTQTVGYRYDAVGHQIGLTYPDGVEMGFVYDTVDRMTYIGHAIPNPTTTGLSSHSIVGAEVVGPPIISIDYDALSHRTRMERDNGLRTLYSVDGASRPVAIEHQRGGGGALERIEYAYNRRGDRIAQATGGLRTQFQYDARSQLIGVTQPAGSPFPSATYGYDDTGNRTAAAGLSYVTNALNQYTSVSGFPLLWDANGNLSSDGLNAYSHDALNRLVGAQGGFGTATYGFDALDRRVRKTVGGVTTWFVYDDTEIIADLAPSGTMVNRYVHGADIDEPLLLERNGERYFYTADGMGSITALVDDFGKVVERYQYDAFGQVVITDGQGSPLAKSAVGNRFTYTGREYDDETGLLHYRHRNYHPRLGRFIERDPLGYVPGVNLYTYVDNNPLGYTDPFGLSKEPGFWSKEPGFLESLIPVWGSARQAIADFNNGNVLSGLFNTGLAIADLGGGWLFKKAGGLLWKTGSHSWNATRKWLAKEGLASFPHQQVHHWLFEQASWVGKKFPGFTNQPWNLMPLGIDRATSEALHQKIHYTNAFNRLWYGSPTWAKVIAGSYAGKFANALAGQLPDGDPGCQ